MFKKKHKDDVDDVGNGDDAVAVPISEMALPGSVIDPVSGGFDNAESFEDELKGDTEQGSSKDSESEPQTYPADCYSFLSLHGPKSGFFYFGLLVWMFQMAFLIIMVVNVIVPTLSTNENDDNPDAEQGAFWAYVVPANAGSLSKITQYMALISYCLFADESLKDIVTAIETFPSFRKARPGDKVFMIATSSILRLIQGALASFVVWLLVANTTNIIDIVLNFTAVNFISSFDDVAFELAQMGKYGPRVKAEADRIEELPAPPCMTRKNDHSRYVWTVVPVAFILLLCMTIVTISQESSNIWLTKKLRVQFKDDPLRGVYNGCYEEIQRVDRRVLFESDPRNEEQGKFGYCQQDKKWYLYTGNKTQPCDLDFIEKVAYSSKTYLFDFSSITEETWYSRTGTPLELYFFDDNKNDLDDEECGSFLGDGKCDRVFNSFDTNYDEGDCCASTCEGLNCGVGGLTTAFGNNTVTGNGYPHCIDPEMRPITIKLNNVYVPVNAGIDDSPGIFDGIDPQDPLMIMDCDGSTVLSLNIRGDMKFATETVNVTDGADCQINVKNITGGPWDLQFVNYTVYHGDSNSIETDPIIMFHADSSIEGKKSFRRIPDCYFDKLSDYVDIPTIYTADGPANKAIQWLMTDSQGYSNCQYDGFVERYALATINFAAPNVVQSDGDGVSTELWITEGMHCVWPNVACVDDSVVELDLGSEAGLFLSGTIATEIALLKNLNYYGVDFAELSGTIPTEIGELSNFEWLILNNNKLTGTIPSEIGQLTDMRALVVGNNNMVGSIPNEIGELSFLRFFFTGFNSFNGTIPTALGSLSELLYISGNDNLLSGPIPSEIGQLTDLRSITLGNNALTGSIPIELLNKSYVDFDFLGNPLSDLIPIEGQEICSAEEGEIYCNCESDCTFRPQHCGCDAAQSCCDTFLSQYETCFVCPTEGVKNPDFYIMDYLTTCQGISDYVQFSLVDFGNEELCYGGKLFFQSIGCSCSSPEDSVDVGGIESMLTDSVGV